MKTQIITLLLLATILANAKEVCKESEELEEVVCDYTNYESYVECERSKKNRAKRSVCNNACDGGGGCDDSCGGCDCNSCSYSFCQSSCSSCCSCCEQYQSCQSTTCCQKTCRATCRSSSCRSSCKKSCYDDVTSQKHSSSSSHNINTNSNTSVINEHKPNITTIIHLNNVINTTNLIDVPITVNNTNFNNITVLTDNEESMSSGQPTIIYTNPNQQPPVIPSPAIPSSVIPPPVIQPPVIQPPVIPLSPPVYPPSGSHPIGHIPQIYPPSGTSHIPPSSSGTDPCCNVISPRQCMRTDKFPYFNCYHYRSQQCGSMCTSNIVHVQPRQVCTNVPYQPPSCHQKIEYIPQPQPKCVYQSVWPYVSCGIQNQASCEGCYEHYYEQNRNVQHSCSPSCYDDGFGIGSYFRQGPFYRPGYSHIPSCLQTGTCGNGGNSPYIFGLGGLGGSGALGSLGSLGGLGGLGGLGYPYGLGGVGNYPLFGSYPLNTYTNNPYTFGFPYAGGNQTTGNYISGFNTTDPSMTKNGEFSANGKHLILGWSNVTKEDEENLRRIFGKRSVKVEEKVEPSPLLNVGPDPFQLIINPQFTSNDLMPKEEDLLLPNQNIRHSEVKNHHHHSHHHKRMADIERDKELDPKKEISEKESDKVITE